MALQFGIAFRIQSHGIIDRQEAGFTFSTTSAAVAEGEHVPIYASRIRTVIVDGKALGSRGYSRGLILYLKPQEV